MIVPDIEVRREALAFLDDYDRISIAFQVTERLVLRDADVGAGAPLRTAPVRPPYVKDQDQLRGHPDLALLWDLRVAPAWRGQGIGAALFGAAARWARQTGARRLMVETQDVNVPACRFYARRGCMLGTVDRLAYPALPDETQLLWYLSLEGSPTA